MGKGTVIYEEVGKTGKLYYYNQNLLKCLDQEEMQQKRQEIEQLEQRVRELNAQIVSHRQRIDYYNSLLSEREYQAEIAAYRGRL